MTLKSWNYTVSGDLSDLQEFQSDRAKFSFDSTLDQKLNNFENSLRKF